MDTRKYFPTLVTVISFVLFLNFQLNGQSPGIECGCRNYGKYVAPASEAIYIQGTLRTQPNSSKNGKYLVEVTDAQYPNIVHLTISLDNTIILSVSSRAVGWGFSLDEDLFVMHGFDIHNKHWYILYDLNPDPSVEGEQAEETVNMGPTDVSSAHLRFSPHGRYLLYAAIGNQGNLVMYIHNAKTGDVVYNPVALIVGSPSGKSVAGWGFSPDKRDRTFAHAMLTNADTYTLIVKNLEKPADKYVLQAPGNTGGANFRFSPCGDYFLWTWQDESNDPTCYFYKTSEENITNDETGSGIGMKKAYTKADGHYIRYFNGDVKIFDNTSDNACDDDDPPSWSGATLTTSNVTGTRVDLSWDAATDASSTIYYKIYQDGSPVKDVESVTQLQITGLVPETPYSFKIEAGDEAGNWSSDGPSANITTLTDNTPEWTAGTLVATDIEGVKMRLSWSGASDDHDSELSYRIYSNGTRIEEIFGNNSYLLTGLDPATTFTLKVEAGDAAGQWTTDGPQLIQATANDNPPTWPAGAEIVTDSVSETTIAFHWPAAEDDWGVTSYLVIRDGDTVKTQKAHEQSILDEDLSEGTTYQYEIKAGDEAGNWSTALSAELSTMPSNVVLPLAVAPGYQGLPDIDDRLVVWQDNRNGNTDIFSYNLNTKEEDALITDPSIQGAPKTAEGRIVWADSRNGNSDIFMYDMYDPLHRTVTICDAASDQVSPVIDGDIVVWSDFRSGNWDIYMLDLTTMQETAVCTNSSSQNFPDISGNIIVWEDARNGNPDIYGYIISSGEEFEVCKHSGEQRNPAVEMKPEYRIFWQDNRNGDWDIYMRVWFVNSYEIYKVSLNYSGNQTNPDIDEEVLVYQDDMNGSWDIYAYTFYNKYYGDMEAISLEDGDQINPRTSKGRIVWEDRRNDDGDIYIWDRPPGTDLALQLAEISDPIGVGKTLKYILTLSNDGPDDESSANIECDLPVEAEFAGATSSHGTLAKDGLKLTWNVGELKNDSSATLEINLKTYTIAKLQFKAQVSGSGFDPDPSNNRISESTSVKLVVGQTLADGSGPSMFVEPSGKAHIFFANDDSTVYGKKNISGQWQFHNLDTISDMQSSDILLDKDGNVHVCYSDQNWDMYPKGRLNYSSNKDTEYWKNKIISLSDSGFSSIAMDINDRDIIHMLYQQSPGAAFGRPHKYMNYKSEKWSQPVLFAEDGYDHIDMVLDEDGYAHVSYFEINKGAIYSKSADTVINNWLAREIIEQDWGGGQLEGMVTDIALDAYNNLHIVYPGNTEDDNKENIKYAYKTNGVWLNEQVDEGDFASGANAIVVEQSGVIHLSYMHFPSREFRYATNIAGPWLKQTIDENIEGWLNVVDMSSDASGNIHMLYENGIIKYAKRPPIQYLNVDPDTIDFGVVEVNSSETLYLKLYNPGEERIFIDSVSMLENEGFIVQDIHTILYPEVQDSIEIVFSPKNNRTYNTYLRIYYNGASQMFMDVPVLATTPMPIIKVIPDPVSFGYVDKGIGKIMTVIITNAGTKDLDISEINVRYEIFGQVYPTDFDLVNQNCTVLGPGESCSALVSFAPTKDGSHTSYLNIYSNDPEYSHKKVRLSGYTSAPQIKAEFNQVDFGYQEANQTSTKYMKIYNIGQIDLNISNTTITGINAGLFDFRNNCTTILAGDSCEMEIDFTPTSIGDFSAVLNLYSNSQYSNPLKINLQGNSVLRNLHIDHGIVDFGENEINARDSMVIVTLTNNGENQLMINETSIIGGDMYEFNNTGCSKTLDAGESCQDTVYFSPVFEGEKQAVLRVSSNDSDEPQFDVVLTGIAIEGELFRLSGEIFDEDGLVDMNKGTLEIFLSGDHQPFRQLGIDGVNEYAFNDLPGGDYTVRFIPDPVAYPEGLPTYLGDVLTLAEATFITLNTDISGQNINVANRPEDGIGVGQINGKLIEEEGNNQVSLAIETGLKSGADNALNNVPVFLTNSSNGKLVGYNLTDATGYFEFTDLEDGSYSFNADYKGIPMDENNPLVVIDQDHRSITILSTAYNEKISTDIEPTGLEDVLFKNGIAVYPNPAMGKLYIRASAMLFENGKLQIQLHDLLGHLLMNKVLQAQDNGVIMIDLQDIPGGMYILTFGGQDKIHTLLISVLK